MKLKVIFNWRFSNMRWILLFSLAIGCQPSDGTDGSRQTDPSSTSTPQPTGNLLTEYAFGSRLDGSDSVSYSGQVFRNLLISDLKSHLGGVSDRIESGAFFPVDGDVYDEIDFYLTFKSDTSGLLSPLFDTELPADQGTYDDVSSGKNLVDKLAGNDEAGQHVDWQNGLVGWDSLPGVTPEQLVRHWADLIDAQAVATANGNAPLDPDGQPIRSVYLTPEGQDLQQLLEKFLGGAIAFSQGADDYLDDDLEDKGLLSDHTNVEEGKNYTALEHAWDEGFGYFGAARTYGTWTDDEIADLGARDIDDSGTIDLISEVCFGHSVNAAKRDRGSSSTDPQDFTAEAWEGFVRGRQLIASTQDALTTEEMAQLKGWRDQAVTAWESALSSTVVHYINDVLQDMNDIGTDDYSFASHAKHWSEMKGFALALQFNPRSPLDDSALEELHDLMGEAPVLTTASLDDLNTYAEDLVAARTLLGDAYGFSDANLGDDSGNNGW